MRYSFNRKDRTLPLYADSVGYNWHQEPIFRPEGYPYVHWLHTQEGCGQIEIMGKKLSLPENTGILINPHIPHSYTATSEDWKTAYFTFGGSLTNEILTLLGIGDYLYLENLKDEFNQFIHKLSLTLNDDHKYLSLEVSGDIYSFLMKLKKYILESSPMISKYETTIQPIVNYLEEHYQEDISNQELADLVNYSTQYTTRLFKKVFQVSPYQYLLEVRIRKAKELLANHPDFSIQEISDLTGFHDASYFISVFKRNEHLTPKAFRKLYFKS